MTQPLSEARQKVGKYEIVEKIGEGGYSSVHRGFDPLIKREVAIKSCTSTDRETRERFYREAEIAGNLDHPNIVRVHDLFIENQTPYLIQELLDGEDLDERIGRGEPISFSEKLYYLIQIARGLEYAHGRGVIHRDVKPANVRVLDDGTVKILDFGIAKLAHLASDLTQKGMTVGTAAYLAPEQIRGEKASPATDIFSFGVLAYELLTAIRPFGRDTISETFFQTLNHDPAPLDAHWSDCPPELVEVVSRCLHKDPAARYGSCGEVLLRLEEIRQSLRADWAPEPNPARTLVLPTGAELALRQPRPASAGNTVQTPVDGPIRERPSPPVDLPLRERPRGIRMAGTGRRRRSRAWIPLTLIAGAAAVVWLWSHRGEIAPRLERASASGGTAARAAVAEPAERQAPEQAAPERAPEPTALREPSADSEPAEVEAPPAPTAPEPREQAAATVEDDPATLSFEGVWHSRIQLSIDGAPPVTLGRSRAVPLEPGRHSLTFSIDGDGYSATRTLGLDLEPGESRRIPVPLEPPGRLTVQAHLGAPQGLVRIGSQRLLRPTPLRSQPIRPGPHRLAFFSHESRSTPILESVVDVRSGWEAIVTFDLEGGLQPHVREKRMQR